MAHCGNHKLYVQSRFTFYNLLPSTQLQNKNMMGYNEPTSIFLSFFGIPVRYPVNHVINLFPCGNSPHPSSLLSKNSILRFQKHTQLKCSMLAMFISNKMRPRSHPCQVPTHPHSSLWICECETWTWHLLSIKLKAPPSSFFTFPETSCVCVRNILGSPFN